jgi:hypothetical protein
MPDTVTEDLADQQDSHVFARVPRGRVPRSRRSGRPARSARPASVTLSRTAALAITAPALAADLPFRVAD